MKPVSKMIRKTEKKPSPTQSPHLASSPEQSRALEISPSTAGKMPAPPRALEQTDGDVEEHALANEIMKLLQGEPMAAT